MGAAPSVGRHLHLLGGHGPGIHHRGESVPQCCCGAREGALAPHSAGPRDFQEEVIGHYRSRSALRPPPWDPKCCEVWGVL